MMAPRTVLYESGSTTKTEVVFPRQVTAQNKTLGTILIEFIVEGQELTLPRPRPFEAREYS
jgi:hypothetical protein